MKLFEIPKTAWPDSFINHKRAPIRVWKSDKYLVQQFSDMIGHAICRLTINSIKRVNGGWADRIPWEDLQAIKDACGYTHHDAIEIYPRQQDIVCDANMRHLWIMPQLISFAWRVS